MLTQLSTVKTRLALTVTDYDGILTNAIKAVSDRFDKETNRTLSRTHPRVRRHRHRSFPALLPHRVRHQIRNQIQRNRRLDRADRRELPAPPAVCHLSQF